MSAISIRLPNYLHQATKALAQKEHVSVNQLITLAIAEKLSALDVNDVLKKRSQHADRKKYLQALASAPDAEPEEADQL